MYIYVYSDLHIEHQQEYDINTLIDTTNIKPKSILILGGDVCTLYYETKLNDFLELVCKYFVQVIYVPGNGEYYKPNSYRTISFSKLNQQIDNLSNKFENLHILNTSSIIINDYLISGCVLWSHITFELPNFFKISGFTKELYNRKNKNDINFIKREIEYAKNNNLKHIIVTHYPPSKDCFKMFKTNDRYMKMYYNNLDHLFVNNITWIYGHTHYNIDKQVKNTRLVSNQYGKHKNKDPNFSNNFYII